MTQNNVPNLDFVYKTPSKFKSNRFLFAGNAFDEIGKLAARFSKNVDPKMNIVMAHNEFRHAIQNNLKYRWLEPLVDSEKLYQKSYLFIVWKPEKNKNLTNRYIRFANELLPNWNIFWLDMTRIPKRDGLELLVTLCNKAVEGETITQVLEKAPVLFRETVFQQLKNYD